MKAVKAKLAETAPDQVEAFEKGAQTYAKKIVSNFKDFEFVGPLTPWAWRYSYNPIVHG
jgi:Translationally controlled tumour protein